MAAGTLGGLVSQIGEQLVQVFRRRHDPKQESSECGNPIHAASPGRSAPASIRLSIAVECVNARDPAGDSL